ncbi:hypothetical protein VBD025_04865 [Virgibacillus flavescens]|uniref:hypothetical protein n=1 Tax=Virgibacillus flavescens TaxID=1611422 RepID=UPI003D329373
MKKVIPILILSLLFLTVGCSPVNSSENDNDKLENNKNNKHLVDAEWKKEIKELDLKFNPKLPTTMPIPIKKAEFSPLPHRPIDVIVVDFYEESGAHISVMITNGGRGRSSIDYEHVKIGNLDGKYFESDSDSEMVKKELRWKENDLHYTLTFYQVRSSVDITKKDLITTAKSFK